MNKRNSKGQYAGSLSIKKLSASWSATAASVALLYVSGTAVMSTIGSFRSCDANASGMFIHSCGKLSLTPGDLVILAIFVASAALTASLVTASWRITTRKVTA